MKSSGLLHLLLICFILASCQVKQGKSGDLISGHLPATNTFTLVTPAAHTYTGNETINLTVTFPFNIIQDTTGGSPRLNLTVGATTRYATLVAQSDPKKLVFEYTFGATENDTDGISVNALELNGSILQFDQNGTIANCDVSTITTTTLTNTKVDTSGPTITAFAITSPVGLYNVGETVSFSMTFSENVTVTGTPRFTVGLTTGGTVNVNYVSGSGTNVLAFSFIVLSTYVDTDGYNPITSPIDLNGGTIKDSVGNNSSLDFSSFTATVLTNTATRDINGEYPFVTNVSVPADGSYAVTDNLDFVLTFNRAVTVTNNPSIALTIGSNTRQAYYASGSGTTQLTFRYQAVPGDSDTDGIAMANSITQNSGTINGTAAPTVSYFADSLNNVFTIPNTSGIRVNVLQPVATAVTRNVDTTFTTCGAAVADNVWIPGQFLYISVTFNTNIYVDQTIGTPSIPITIGSTTKQATYLSGGNGQTILTFQYVVVDGDLDLDGTIAIGSINLNSGVITDASNTNILLTLPVAGLTTTNIDGVKPTISNVTAPANGTYSAVAPLNPAAMDLTVNWSEPVHYSATGAADTYMNSDMGGSATNLIYAGGNDSAAIIYNPANLTGKNDTNGITITSPLAGTAVIQDCPGNIGTPPFTFTPPTTTGILVDTTAPIATSVVAITANGTYKANDNLDFTVTFNESVTTLVAGLYPRIPVTIGSTTNYLVPTANATNTTHTFRYTVATNDLDTDGIAVGTTLTHNGTTAYARDAGRNNATAGFTSPNTTGIRVDAVVPTVTGSSGTVSGAYITGDTIQISVTYSENVTVVGSPYIALDFDSGTDDLPLTSGSGTTTLVFSRTLTGTHFDMNGLAASITSINLNGGTIRDVGANNAPTTFPAIDFSSVFVTYAGVKLWVQSDFTNLAPSPTGVTNNGVITTEACGAGTCRTFDGDDSLDLSGSLSNVTYVYIVAKTPPAVLGNKNLFTNDIHLSDQTSNYDLATIDPATVTVGGTTYNPNDTAHNTNFSDGTNYVMQIVYQTTHNYSGTTLIPATFNGAIGEVIAVEGALTATQRDNIRNYLLGKY